MSYYFADHLGSSRIVTDASGNVLDDSAGGAYMVWFAMCAARVLFCEGIKLKSEIPIQCA